ncbi:MAG TPA: MarR family transcriptional regulator [Propylenella sp.]|jgi:DNA-binding MarR family transcriptional regulator
MAVQIRSGHALRLWHDVSLALVRRSEPDLSLRQVTILITIYLDPQPHTVRALAAKIGVTKPVITRALDTMGRLGLVTRKRDPNDRRNVLVQRTVDGALFLERLADLVVARAAALPA